jgi:hypothetical protein
MDIQSQLRALQQFRDGLHLALPQRADTLLDVLDALSSNLSARSPAELSLNPLCRRTHNSVYDGIQSFSLSAKPTSLEAEHQVFTQRVLDLIVPTLPAPQRQKFRLFGLDVTPAARPFARTLADRTFVHQPNPIGANKPITIGHAYSVLAALPEKASPTAPPWVVPLLVQRVDSASTPAQIGVAQTRLMLKHVPPSAPQALCVEVADSAYSGPTFLSPLADQPQLVIVTRARNNRVFYRSPTPAAAQVGHPTWYGMEMALKKPDTWSPPDERHTTTWTTRQGKTFTVRLEAWQDMRMRGHKDQPMQTQPFTLVRVQVLNAFGQPISARPLWLLAVGPRRGELTLVEIWDAYRQRYDLEHFFRFGKQRLLLTAYHTPDVQHEEHWWQIGQLAYVQLWLVRQLVDSLPRPWERYLPVSSAGPVSPATAQRRFAEITRQIGTPAAPPKPRGNPVGRAKGTRPAPRLRQPVIKKGKMTAAPA